MTQLSVAPPPPWLRALRSPVTRILVLGCGLFYLMGWTQGRLLALEDSPLLASGVALGLGLVAIAIYMAYGKLVERRNVIAELSTSGMGRELAVGMAVGAALYTACVLILIALGLYRIEALNPLSFLLPAIPMVVKSAIFEELVFRGVLVKSVEDLAGSWAAVLVSSAAFGVVHLLNPGATLIGAIYISIEAGLLLAGAYLVTRRLWLCIGFHLAWNYVQSAVFSGVVSGGFTDPGLFKATIAGPDLLTGGSFGMERSIFALVLCTTAGVILLVIAARRGHILPPPWRREI